MTSILSGVIILVATTERVRQVRTKAAGVWTMLGTFVILTGIAVVSGSFAEAFDLLLSFVTFNAGSIDHHDGLSFSTLGVLAAIVAIDLAVCLAIVYGLHAVTRLPSSGTTFEKLFGKKDASFAKIMVILVLEELFARALFLGLFGMWLKGEVWTYVLFLIGNGIWALVHLTNFSKAEDRKLLLVLPQFVGGIMLSAVFLAYGFLAALLAHVAYDMLLFSMHKMRKVSWRDGAILLYNAVLLLVGLAFVWGKLPDLVSWTQMDGSFAMSGWSFWDYLWMLVAAQAALTIVARVLAFDYSNPEEEYSVLTYIILSVLVTAGLVGLYYMLGFVIEDTLSRLIVASGLWLMMSITQGGSQLANAFWIGIPTVMLTLCTILALGFWPGMLMVCLVLLAGFPERIIMRRQPV